MTVTDASVDISLRATKMPVQAGTFYVEPFSEAPQDLEVSEFVDYNLFDASRPFQLTLEDVLRMFEDGFAVLEKVWELREWAPKKAMANRKKYTMLRKLGPRPSTTIKEITYDDNGGPVAVVQNAIRADKKIDEVTIPIEKAMIFTLNGKGGDLEGRSILRTAYPHWYYKTYLYKIDAIQKERHGIGIPDIEVGPGADEADKVAARELGENLRTNEKAHVVRPPHIKVGFIKIEGQPVDALASADHHDGMIMKNVFVQFLNLGLQGSGGGRATSGSHMDMFMKSLRYVANLVCQYFNLYLIPQLVSYNFDTKNYPKLKVRNVGEARDLQMFASAISNLVLKGVITMDQETEQWAREQFDMPKKLGERPADVVKNRNGVPGRPEDAGNVGKPDNAFS
jgi:hypothetical protein